MKIGSGFDVHAFGPGSFVMLAGVRVPHSAGLIAHSDGDVVLHALCDALLGAAGLGDAHQSHVAALLGPLVGLFHQHRADQPDDGVTVGEDADHVGTPADLPVEPLLGLWDQTCRQTSRGKPQKANRSLSAAVRCSAAAGNLAASASTTRMNWAAT